MPSIAPQPQLPEAVSTGLPAGVGFAAENDAGPEWATDGPALHAERPLHIDARPTSGSDERLVEQLRALAHCEAALRMREARLLAWLKRQDVMELGYTSFSAFLAERVDIGGSHVRGLIRLVESDLDQVKWEVCAGRVPIREAVRAPTLLQPADQEAWIAQVRAGKKCADPVETSFIGKPVHGENAQIVRRGRSLARLLLGRRATDREVDQKVLSWHRQRVPAQRLLEMALKAPEPPEHPPLSSEGFPSDDPTVPLLGPWRQPRSLTQAVAELDRLQAVSRGRQAVLAMAWAEISHEKLWWSLGFPTATAFVEDVFGVSARTAARWRQVGRGMHQYPELRQAVREGLDLDRAHWVSNAARWGQASATDWIAVAARMGQQELKCHEADLRCEPERAMRRFQQAIELADRWDAERCDRVPDDLTSVGGRRGDPDDLTSVGGPGSSRGRLRVSLPPLEPDRPDPRPVLAVPGLVEACRWLLGHVKLPHPGRFNQVKHRDRFTCQNPECGRRSLRVHKHHIVERSQGGSDDPDNLVTLCVSCHLRGVHTGRIGLQAVDVFGHRALLWTFPDGRRVLGFREPAWD